MSIPALSVLLIFSGINGKGCLPVSELGRFHPSTALTRQQASLEVVKRELVAEEGPEAANADVR